MWWSERERSYKPRDPSKSIDLSRPEGWMPETPEEIKESLKITRLQHDQAKVGAVYNYFGKVRVVNIFNEPPQVQVFDLHGPGHAIFYMDKLEAKRHLEPAKKNRSCRNRAKRRTARRASCKV